MECLWFKILMEDPYPDLSFSVIALCLASWRSLLCNPCLPHASSLLVAERHYPSPPLPQAPFSQHSQQPPLGLSSSLAIWMSEAGKSSLIFDDITKSTCSFFVLDRIKKQSSHQESPPRKWTTVGLGVTAGWSGQHWAGNQRAWALILAWKPTSV